MATHEYDLLDEKDALESILNEIYQEATGKKPEYSRNFTHNDAKERILATFKHLRRIIPPMGQ
jgi:hypothetical protein